MSALTRQHFEIIAEGLYNARPFDHAPATDAELVDRVRWDTWVTACLTMADTLSVCNHRFNRARFLSACGCGVQP